MKIEINNEELINFFQTQKNPEEFLIYSMNLYNYFKKKPEKEEILELLTEIVNSKNSEIKNSFENLTNLFNSSIEKSNFEIKNSLERSNSDIKNSLDKSSFNLKMDLNTNLPRILSSEISDSIKIKTIQERIEDLTETFKSTSSKKGEYSQNKFIQNLYIEFPEHEIIDTTDQGGETDFQLKKNGMPDILIELKNYNSPIPKKEIDKFYRDTVDKCGILVSISSGISNKKDFSFEIKSKSILFFLCLNGFDTTRIKFAVSVIYKIYFTFLLDKKINIELSNEQIEILKREYDLIQSIKINLSEKLKQMQKEVNKIEIKSLDSILKCEKKEEIKINWCEECQKSYSSKTALSKHLSTKHKN